jgi:hypothetical protein
MTTGRLLPAILAKQQTENFLRFPQPRDGDGCGYLPFAEILVRITIRVG